MTDMHCQINDVIEISCCVLLQLFFFAYQLTHFVAKLIQAPTFQIGMALPIIFIAVVALFYWCSY